MKIYILLLSSLALFCSGCATSPTENKEKKNLEKFAYANCLLQYFNSKSYDTESIRNISGGLVEVGKESAETYASIAKIISTMNMGIETKSNIDPKLNRCFHLDKNGELMDIINQKS